ncbi:MAG: PAS domain S-box protein, partial [Haloglomus sp.]
RDAILVVDADGRIVDCNPAFTDLFGYEPEAIEGEPTTVLFASEAEFARLQQVVDQPADSRGPVETVDYVKRSGQVFPGETNVFRFHDRSGETVGFLGLIRDVSEREERLTQIKNIDRVLRHNLNNALTVVLGNAEAIERRARGELAREAARIAETGRQLQETSEKERQITKFLAARRSVAERDIAAVVRAEANAVVERHPAADVAVDAPERQPVLAVPEIGRAVAELVENAVVHSDRDEPSLTLSVESTARGLVTVDVADDGPGIPETERQLLTGELEIQPLLHGSGLGLWLVTLVVQHSDGTIAVEDNDPRGSVVTLTLPTP